jgi:class 3 adenylate cyclase
MGPPGTNVHRCGTAGQLLAITKAISDSRKPWTRFRALAARVMVESGRSEPAESAEFTAGPFSGLVSRLSSLQPVCYSRLPERSEARMEAERRQVTVLFSDMVGFTSFSERSGEEVCRI